MSTESTPAKGWLLSFIVVATSVVGYFVGLQAPMPEHVKRKGNASANTESHNLGTDLSGGNSSENKLQADQPAQPSAIDAVNYQGIADATRQRGRSQRTLLSELKTNVDPLREFTVTHAEKLFALQLRARNRAFNGAPPTIPHAIDQSSTLACMACHGEGISTGSLRVSKMSHQYLSNCTQCHVEANPIQQPAIEFRETTFTGLPAPTGGPTAYPGAPPQIPHTTWMRVDCLSCHGFSAPQGIRTTHPWRQNCQQCHTTSSTLDQVLIEPQPQFLPSPKIDPPAPAKNPINNAP